MGTSRKGMRARLASAACLLMCHAGAASAIAPGWICFGVEPSWSLRFADASRATLAFPDRGPVDHAGATRALPHLREWMWRGAPRPGSGEAVAFVREAACSDGMSDTKHPAAVRLSLPDGSFLAGCCRVAATGEGGRALEDRRWRLAGVSGAEADLAAVKTPPTLRFSGGRVEGFGGCNTLAGSYTLDGDRLVIGALAGTMMACAPRVMALETALTRALAGTFRVDAREQTLALTGSAGVELTFVEAPMPALEGRRWPVTGFNNGRQAVVSPLSGTSPWLEFAQGRVNGHTGCNTFRGSYKVDGGTLAIGPLAVTRKACQRPGLMQQESELLAALRSATKWTIDARGMLDMHRPDGERALTAGDPR